MIKWIKELFKPPVDRTEIRIREQFQFMFVDYGFSFDKVDLGNLLFFSQKESITLEK